MSIIFVPAFRPVRWVPPALPECSAGITHFLEQAEHITLVVNAALVDFASVVVRTLQRSQDDVEPLNDAFQTLKATLDTVSLSELHETGVALQKCYPDACLAVVFSMLFVDLLFLRHQLDAICSDFEPLELTPAARPMLQAALQDWDRLLEVSPPAR